MSLLNVIVRNFLSRNVRRLHIKSVFGQRFIEKALGLVREQVGE